MGDKIGKLNIFAQNFSEPVNEENTNSDSDYSSGKGFRGRHMLKHTNNRQKWDQGRCE